MAMTVLTQEEERLADNGAHRVFWKKWGPYLSERQWGTVREDYSPGGAAWNYFPFDHARSRAYRWGEDGLAGISDIHQQLCFSIALWNGQDPILKERLFGLNNGEGNHCEDVKELYYYLDNTPTHSYMKYLYKYPQGEFPYGSLVEENRKRTRSEPEYELLDTGLFAGDRYFDVFVEYAKAGPDDILINISIFNRGATAAPLTVLPTLWFRNTWSFAPAGQRPEIKLLSGKDGAALLAAEHPELGTYYLFCADTAEVLFTENETNYERIFGTPNRSPFVKDAFHEVIVAGQTGLLQGKQAGTKSAAVYRCDIAGGASVTLRLRLADKPLEKPFAGDFAATFGQRQAEADAFYARFIPEQIVSDVVEVQRQAFAGLLWNKQFYNYEVEAWLKGDPGQPVPPAKRKEGRNQAWRHLFNKDVISMPDKWEYPWYASWDLAFHCIPLAVIDPDFAKKQLLLLLREWYMHPNGQLPAYEWNFSDVNPPVQAWTAMKVYEIEKAAQGHGDTDFLKRVFHKLLLNFTWWVNRKDAEGRNIFQGGFLGLDNIGIFDRSQALPTGGHIEQADGTSWMAMYALSMMDMALEIALVDPAYEDVASKFFEHFVHIAESLNAFGRHGLWHEEDGFYYDVLHLPDETVRPLRVRSLVGLTSLFAVSVIKGEHFERFPGFRKRMLWFRKQREEQGSYGYVEELQENGDILLTLVPQHRLIRVMERLFNEEEFLATGGIRSISKYHETNPFVLQVNGHEYRVDYEPAESRTGLFGGNSNWRGPIWVPINYLFIESLKKYYTYFGDTFTVELPSGSGTFVNLWEAAKLLSQRLSGIFIRREDGYRHVHGEEERYQKDPHFRDLVLFYEYFHGDECKGLGASHQTGWTGLVAEMIKWCWCK